MNTETVTQRITDFRRRFGEAHLYLAYHAAFPLSLTPDLTYRLWTNFQRDAAGNALTSKAGRVLRIPWVAVADLLLSNLCNEVAHDLYEMAPPIRQELLARLRQDERFGDVRIHELASFVETYFEQHLHSEDSHLRNFATTQRWITVAYRNPNQVAAELANEMAAHIRKNDKAGILRTTAILNSVAAPLEQAGLEPFLTYSRNMAEFARGRTTAAKEYAREFLTTKTQLQVAGVPLPIPEALQDRTATGTVKWCNAVQEYGMLTINDDEEAFFHYRDILPQDDEDDNGIVDIYAWYQVQCSLIETDSGLQARNIKVLQKERSRPFEEKEYIPSQRSDEKTESTQQASVSVDERNEAASVLSQEKKSLNMNLKQIQPTIVIGLGGTGVKAVTYLKKVLQEESADSREFVRFLAIDIDELRGEIKFSFLFGEDTRLDQEKNEFFRITDQTRGDAVKNIPSVNSWFPEEGYKYLPLTEGAHQAKPVGRLGFFLSHPEISRCLHNLTDRLVTPEVLQCFPAIRAGELNVYIVGSICGGTGGGLFLDIAYELRYLQQQAQLPGKSRIKGLFALSDVYDAISNRVQANTYASLLELNWIQREKAEFHPAYPDGTRDLIKSRAFDTIYLFGDSNKSDIQIASPFDFAQLCTEFIFLDSGSDVQETGDPLSKMMQANRSSAEKYILNYDVDGTPRCYSALGLCKIHFPAERVAELCAARMSKAIIDYHIIGQLDESEILEVRQKVKEFLTNEGLGCSEDSSDLPNRMVEKVQENKERVVLYEWITKGLSKAYKADMENIKKLEVGRITGIVQKLNSELDQFQKDMPDRVLGELLSFQRLLDLAIKEMFQDNLGVNFVQRFLDELLESAKQSQEYATLEMRSLLEHEKRLSDRMNSQLRELGNVLGGGLLDFLKRQAQLAQLKDTYKAIRQHFNHRINIMKMRATIDFYNGMFDAKQKLLEGGEGAVTRLTNMQNTIFLIQKFVENLGWTFHTAYEENKRIVGSPFEILIYDNDRFSNLENIYGAVYNEGLRGQLFQAILGRVGGSIWSLRDYMDDEESRLRDVFMSVSTPPFEEHINQKTVAQRIVETRKAEPSIDYAPRLSSAYDLSDYFCRLDEAVSRWADLRSSEQSVAFVVGPINEEDNAWNEVAQTLREAIGRGGATLPFTKASDPHSILIYREFCGFPAYTLNRINAYQRAYIEEARRENTPPLQMLTREQLDFINVPNRPVLSKFDIMVIEAIALGVIVNDGDYYYMLTANEYKRQQEALAKQRRGENASIEDRNAGKHRRLGSRFTEVVARMNSKLPDEARESTKEIKWRHLVQKHIEQRKKALIDKDEHDLLCDLYEVLYFNGYDGTSVERIDLDKEVKPAIVFILKRDFALKQEHIFRPKDEEGCELTHEQLLHKLYVGTNEESPLVQPSLHPLPKEREGFYAAQQRLVDFLCSLPSVHSRAARDTLLISAGLDAALHNNLSSDLPVGHFFAQVVDEAAKYGNLQDGRNALDAVVAAAKQQVSPNRQREADAALHQFRAVRGNSAAPSATASPPFSISALKKQRLEARWADLSRKNQALSAQLSTVLSAEETMSIESRLEQLEQEMQELERRLGRSVTP